MTSGNANPDPVLPAAGAGVRTNWTRAEFLRWCRRAAATACVGAPLYAFGIEPHWVSWVSRSLPIVNLPPSLVGRTLVQVSDLHIGPVVDDNYLEQVLRRVQSLDPEIVVMTGDWVTLQNSRPLWEKLDRHLQHFPRGRLATLSVLGNHDYGNAFKYDSEDGGRTLADGITSRLTDAGLTVLRNEVRSVSGLAIAGVDDFWGPSFRPAETFAQLPPDAAQLVLCHNPDAVDTDAFRQLRDCWVLSGHTHGGQCQIPWVTAPIVPIKNRNYVEGAVPLPNGVTLYVNRGLGYLRRVRFAARPEVTVFTLTRAERGSV